MTSLRAALAFGLCVTLFVCAALLNGLPASNAGAQTPDPPASTAPDTAHGPPDSAPAPSAPPPAGTLPGVEAAAADTPPAQDLVVTGEAPGPGLWRAAKGDHELWILGLVPYLPKGVQWRNKNVAAIIAEADAILPAQANLNIPIGPIRSARFFLALFPSAVSIASDINHEHHATTRDLTPPDLYARYLALCETYHCHAERFERRRFAITGLNVEQHARAELGLSYRDSLQRKIEALANRHHSAKIAVEYELPPAAKRLATDKIFIRGLIDRVKDDLLSEDVGCFAQTLDRVETGLTVERRRANAWAKGDVATLLSLPPPMLTRCEAAAIDSFRAVFDGLKTMPRWREALADLPDPDRLWHERALAAIETHKTSFLAVGIDKLTGDAGILAWLAGQGYRIEAPG